MTRKAVTCSLILLFLIGTTVAFGAPALVVAPRLQARPVLSAQVLHTNLDRALQLRRVPNSAQILGVTEKLPADVRQSAVALFDQNTAMAIGQPDLFASGKYLTEISSAVLKAIYAAMATPVLDSLTPAGGGHPNEWAAALGSFFNTNDKVMFNGTEAPTVCMSGGLLFFTVPASAALGSTYPVYVRNTLAGKNSATLNFKIVAPRGYRGVYGLGFFNFSDATIPWEVYRHCFGASTVEFPNGTHRPSANAWYNSAYKGCGSSGNCFGMALLSLRTRLWYLGTDTHALDTVIYGSWIKTQGAWAPWALPAGTQMHQSVQELMAYQLCAPISTYTAGQKSAQNNNQAWTTADTAIHTEGQMVQESLYGHAVVTYWTTSSGATRTFMFYDNNVPYTETETGGPDKSLGTLNSGTGSFSYAGYTHIATYHVSGLLGPPQLPAGVGGAGDNAADSAMIETPRDGTLTITDEAGRGGANGVGVPGLSEIIVEGGLGPMPASYPRLFVLQGVAGRSLNINFVGQGARQREIAYFGRGVVLQATAGGQQLQASLSGLGNPDVQIRFANPQAAMVSQVRMIGVLGAQEERVITLDQFAGLGAGATGFGLTADRGAAAISVASGVPLRLRLQLETQRATGVSRSTPSLQTADVGRLTRFAPQTWGNLQGGAINRGIINLPGGMR